VCDTCSGSAAVSRWSHCGGADSPNHLFAILARRSRLAAATDRPSAAVKAKHPCYPFSKPCSMGASRWCPLNSCGLPAGNRQSPSAGSGGAIATSALPPARLSDGPLGRCLLAEARSLTQPEADLEVCLHAPGDCRRDWMNHRLELAWLISSATLLGAALDRPQRPDQASSHHQQVCHNLLLFS